MKDEELERRFPDPEDRRRYKDQDRAAGRLEIRVFELLVEHGERKRGSFLNKGKGNEGLAKDRECGFLYLATKKDSILADYKKKITSEAEQKEFSSQELEDMIEWMAAPLGLGAVTCASAWA